MAIDPLADQWPRQVTDHKWHHQLQNDRTDGVQYVGIAALGMHQRPHQQRRQEHAENARCRGAADRRRHVAARRRRKGDGRLHRGRQRAQVEEAEIDRRRHDARHQQVHRQPEQREQRKGAEEHQQVQLPVTHAGDDRLARQLGAVHKEQQRDGGGGQVFKEGFPDAFAGEQRGDDHHQNQNQQKFINAQTLQPGHETDFLARKVVKRPDVAPGTEE